MAPRGNKLIVMGASAGGIEAFKAIMADLPPKLPASVVIVQHTGPNGLHVLDRIFARSGPLPVSYARNFEPLSAGHIYVAPHDCHLIVEAPGQLRLTRGPRENRFRPAVDPLFRSAAASHGPQVIGVVLTGWLDDGTAGLWAIKEHGGVAIVQHPEDAVAPSMPMSALKHVEVNHCVPLREIAPLLTRLAQTAAEPTPVAPTPKSMETDLKIAKEENTIDSGIVEWGAPSIFACPECHGVLLQLKEGSHLRFRCHTGHAYSLDSLLAEYTERSEDTLWNSVRALEETELLLKTMEQQLRSHGRPIEADSLAAKARDWKQRANQVRGVLMPGPSQPGK